MAKHRKKQQWKKRKADILKVPDTRASKAGKGSYTIALENGNMLAEYIIGKGVNVLPNRSIGKTKSMRQLRDIYNYYARAEIQKEMFQYAAGRKITYLRLFKPQFEFIRSAEDILPIALYTLFQRGNYWPSLHGTISKFGKSGQRICDIVIEIDYKSGWETCFDLTRPVIRWLNDIGAVFKIKFSGNCSPHIIIPAEAFPEKVDGKYMFPGQHSMFFRNLTEIIKSKIKEPRYLDTSFHIQDHFLRLAYSLNESTGLVSLPIPIGQFDHFTPARAQLSAVKPVSGWWSVPKDSAKRMEDFIRTVLHGRVIISTKRVSLALRGQPTDARATVMRPRRRKPLLIPESLLTNEALYEHMVEVGQDRIDLRDFLLLEEQNIKDALRMLRRFLKNGRKIDIPTVAKLYGVDGEDLRFLWQWELNERVFRYYGRDEVRQAIHEHAKFRKVRAGCEERAVVLHEPMDVLPLAVYAHFDANKRAKYPAFTCTTSKYNLDGRAPISCDAFIYFITKHENESSFEAAQPVVAMLVGAGVTFFMFYDGISGPNIIIPFEAFPQDKNWVIKRHEQMVGELSTYLKHFMRMPGAACRFAKDPHTFLPVPYSVHPDTELACIPIIPSEIHNFSTKDAWLGNTEVDNDWWDIPPDAQRSTKRFLEDVILTPIT